MRAVRFGVTLQIGRRVIDAPDYGHLPQDLLVIQIPFSAVIDAVVALGATVGALGPGVGLSRDELEDLGTGLLLTAKLESEEDGDLDVVVQLASPSVGRRLRSV